LTYLRLISVIAPLLGLLGTMLGMVKVFQNVATRTAVDSTVLASGIWEALLTTIFGLSVAIPTLVFYYHLSLKLKGFRIEAVEHSYRAVEVLGVTCDLPDLSEDSAEGADRPKSEALGIAPPQLERRMS
jgi:biopolymer transport protein ExbB